MLITLSLTGAASDPNTAMTNLTQHSATATHLSQHNGEDTKAAPAKSHGLKLLVAALDVAEGPAQQPTVNSSELSKKKTKKNKKKNKKKKKATKIDNDNGNDNDEKAKSQDDICQATAPASENLVVAGRNVEDHVAKNGDIKDRTLESHIVESHTVEGNNAKDNDFKDEDARQPNSLVSMPMSESQPAASENKLSTRSVKSASKTGYTVAVPNIFASKTGSLKAKTEIDTGKALDTKTVTKNGTINAAESVMLNVKGDGPTANAHETAFLNAGTPAHNGNVKAEKGNSASHGVAKMGSFKIEVKKNTTKPADALPQGGISKPKKEHELSHRTSKKSNAISQNGFAGITDRDDSVFNDGKTRSAKTDAPKGDAVTQKGRGHNRKDNTTVYGPAMDKSTDSYKDCSRSEVDEYAVDSSCQSGGIGDSNITKDDTASRMNKPFVAITGHEDQTGRQPSTSTSIKTSNQAARVVGLSNPQIEMTSPPRAPVIAHGSFGKIKPKKKEPEARIPTSVANTNGALNWNDIGTKRRAASIKSTSLSLATPITTQTAQKPSTTVKPSGTIASYSDAQKVAREDRDKVYSARNTFESFVQTVVGDTFNDTDSSTMKSTDSGPEIQVPTKVENAELLLIGGSMASGKVVCSSTPGGAVVAGDGAFDIEEALTAKKVESTFDHSTMVGSTTTVHIGKAPVKYDVMAQSKQDIEKSLVTEKGEPGAMDGAMVSKSSEKLIPNASEATVKLTNEQLTAVANADTATKNLNTEIPGDKANSIGDASVCLVGPKVKPVEPGTVQRIDTENKKDSAVDALRASHPQMSVPAERNEPISTEENPIFASSGAKIKPGFSMRDLTEREKHTVRTWEEATDKIPVREVPWTTEDKKTYDETPSLRGPSWLPLEQRGSYFY
jgi:hypothetical protein